MDDILSILIYIIVIISFLSSLFKKKKTPETPPQQQSRVPQDRIPGNMDDNERPPQKREVSDYDILREIENMFKTGPGGEETVTGTGRPERAIEKAPPSERVSYEEYTSGSESIKTASEHQATSSEHKYHKVQRKPVKVDKKTEEKARRFQEMLEWKASGQDVFIDNLVRKIKEPATIREFIIVSEILGKPKSLRR